jgi:hypothetical protein
MTRTWLNGDWYRSYSGAELVADNPDPASIKLEDIAHHLSMICRFGGACPVFYSVASHSVYVTDLLPTELKVEGLLHDATEAYVGDMIKCIKRHCKDYQRLEHVWELAIRDRFGLPTRPAPAVKAAIKRADIAALLAERRDIFKDRTAYNEISEPGPLTAVTASPAVAKALFLDYALDLGLS